MTGFGYGLKIHHPRFLHSDKGSPDHMSVEPGASWDGTAGSGFAAAPVDPARTTAKPAMRLLTPPNQYFLDELVVGVIAGADDGGTLLLNMGLQKITARFEGASADITAPSFHTFEDANGVSRTYFGWWAKLKKPAGKSGHANLYFEAVPRDATMQNRVIGPYQFSPVDPFPATGTVHDYEIEVAATPAQVTGATYKTIDAAMAYLKSVGAQNPKITITETGLYSPKNGAAQYTPEGRCLVEASVPVTLGLAAMGTDTAAAARVRFKRSWFRGENITFDMRYLAQIYTETVPHIFDGVRFNNSGGREEPWKMGSRPAAYCVSGEAWFTECSFTDTLQAGANPLLQRGCSFDHGWADMMNGVHCAVGCSFSNWTSNDYNIPRDALSVRYTGAGATATLSLTGTNLSNNRVLTAKVDGASVGTFTIVNTEAGYDAYVADPGNAFYAVEDVVAWLNTLTDWTATLGDNTLKAASLNDGVSAGAGAFTDLDAKSADLHLYTNIDAHTDWYQKGTSTPFENVILWGNIGVNISCQNYMVGGDGVTADWLCINNAIVNDPTDPINNLAARDKFGSQFNTVHSHHVFVHNTFATQKLVLREEYDADSHCLITNNVLRNLESVNTLDPDMVMSGNVVHAGNATSTVGADTVEAGDETSLFVGAEAGDFTPAGELLANLKVPVVAYDRTGQKRGALAPAGSEA